MKKLLLALILAAACSPESENGRDGADGTQAGGGRAEPARIGSLVGLYEGGEARPRHQMCVVEGEGGTERFGLVVWGGNMHSCSGAGTVTREGDRLKLAMAGDSACTIEASVSGRTIRLPNTMPEGCAYYCGARARLAGAELTQTGTTEADALKAQDLVGEPLCAAEAN